MQVPALRIEDRTAAIEACPASRLLSRLGERWAPFLLAELSSGVRRYGELRRLVPSASQKMLTQTLRRLERDGLVRRTVQPGRVVHVEYELTLLGASLHNAVDTLGAWARSNIDEIDRARLDFDKAARAAE